MRAIASDIPERAVSEAPPVPPFRLRFLLIAALCYGAWALAYPRASAAWKLHGQATALADYGACMAGPTGPTLLRDHQVEQFQALVRRRLIAAPAGEAPFERCATLARGLTDSPEIESAHRAKAGAFAEYGGHAKEHSLAELGSPTGRLPELARSAWPFVRGYALLVKPSLGAKEAPHPVAPPEPAVGKGLPSGRALYRATRVEPTGIVLASGTGANSEALRSSDGGATWRPASSARVRDIAGRCLSGTSGRAFTLERTDDGGTNALSLEPPGEPRTAPLARPSEEVTALACDEGALVAVFHSEGTTRAILRQCAFGGACTALTAPGLGGVETGLDFPVDIARVNGTTLVALTMGHVVRVASSRDAGASWTPFSVAYDAGEHALPGSRAPTELLTIGRRVLLHGTAVRAGETYGLLYSDDQGASWHGR